ncbi:hypothetical protein ACFRJ8_01560 [Arthrobacter sp. NPDC056886]|uniref:hypothetical protein n=1 Tax=Arthrobacter sp. NPDC056886 TaxID=3345960 RepID=UPI00366F3027
MATSQFDQFLQEATIQDSGSDHALGKDCLYGLYTSWCFLNQITPQAEDAFWAAMQAKQIHPERTRLRMKGPAAADYILASYPALV